MLFTPHCGSTLVVVNCSWHKDLSDQTTFFHSSTVSSWCFLSHCKCLGQFTMDWKSTPHTRLLLYLIQTRLHRIVCSEIDCCIPQLYCDVRCHTVDNLLWPEAQDVPHIHLPRAASLNSKVFEEWLHFVHRCECQSLWNSQISYILWSESV